MSPPLKQALKRVPTSTKVSPGFSGEVETIKISPDSLLQSPTSGRRYMRRGSKTPSMLMLSNMSAFATPLDARDEKLSGRRDTAETSHKRQMLLISLLSWQISTDPAFESGSV